MLYSLTFFSRLFQINVSMHVVINQSSGDTCLIGNLKRTTSKIVLKRLNQVKKLVPLLLVTRPPCIVITSIVNCDEWLWPGHPGVCVRDPEDGGAQPSLAGWGPGEVRAPGPRPHQRHLAPGRSHRVQHTHATRYQMNYPLLSLYVTYITWQQITHRLPGQWKEN